MWVLIHICSTKHKPSWADKHLGVPSQRRIRFLYVCFHHDQISVSGLGFYLLCTFTNGAKLGWVLCSVDRCCQIPSPHVPMPAGPVPVPASPYCWWQGRAELAECPGRCAAASALHNSPVCYCFAIAAVSCSFTTSEPLGKVYRSIPGFLCSQMSCYSRSQGRGCGA